MQEPLDRSMLEGMAKSRPQLAERLIKLYFSHAPMAFSAMVEAARDGRFESVRMGAHSLKSSSATLGAMPLAGLFKELELCAAGGDPDAIRSLVERCSAEFDRASAALSSLQSELETVHRAAS